MATVIDLLRHLGQHAAPNGENALAGPVVLSGVSDAVLSLPLAPNLVEAWSQAVERTTLGHHALALSAAQAGHSVALMGHGQAPHADLLLLSLSQLRFEQTTLWIVPEEAGALRATLIQLADKLHIRWVDAASPGARVTQAHLVLATPRDLHRRILRFHDRAWRWLWPRLRLIAIPELHRFTAVRGGHLRWLLRRVGRLAGGQLQVLCSLAPNADAEGTLNRLLARPAHIIAAPGGPTHNTLIALWRSGGDRQKTILGLAQQLAARRLAVTALGRTAEETEQLRSALRAADVAQADDEPRVALVAGIPATVEARQSLLRTNYRLLLLLVGDQPHERLLAAQPDLLLQALPRWPLATSNPYIATANLACAAAELPVSAAEIDQWQMRELRDRLLRKGSLITLPSGDLWQSAPTAEEPYSSLDPDAISGPPSLVVDPHGNPHGAISNALLDRCALPGQLFEPGLRVAGRDDEARRVQLAADDLERATLVQADMAVTVREELAARTVRWGKVVADLTRGKVVAKQQVWGIREYLPTGEQREHRLAAPVETQWTAAGCWIKLPSAPDARCLGWALQAALPFIILAQPCTLAVSYDATLQRLFVLEAESGGVGLADCVYDEFERLIDFAYVLTLACVDSPIFGQIAASERDWLAVLRGDKPTVRAAPAARETQPQRLPAAEAASASAKPANVYTPPSGTLANPTPSLANGARRVPLQPPAAPADAAQGTVDQRAVAATQEGAVRVRAADDLLHSGSEPPRLPTLKPEKQLPEAQPSAEMMPIQSAVAQSTVIEESLRAPVPPIQAALPSVVQYSVNTVGEAVHATPAEPQDTGTSTIERSVSEPLDSTSHKNVEDEPRSTAEEQSAIPQTTRSVATEAPGSATVADVRPEPGPFARRAAVYHTPQRETAPPAAPLLSVPTEPATAEALPGSAPVGRGTEPDRHGVAETAGRFAAEAADAPPEEPTEASTVKQATSEQALDPQPRQYEIDDLLPPVDDDPPDQHDAMRAEPAEEPANLPLITPFRPPARTRRSDQRPPIEPRPPLPFRRPGQPPQRSQPSASNDQQRSQDESAPPTSLNMGLNRPSRPAPSTTEPNRSQSIAGRTSDVAPEPAEPTKGKRFEQTRRDVLPTDERRINYPNQPPPNRAKQSPSEQQSTQRPFTPRPDRPDGTDTQGSGARTPQAGQGAPAARGRQKPPAQAEPVANVSDMIARMRRLREQREAEQGQRRSPPISRPNRSTPPVEPRFDIGERVQCLPYGIGIVRASRLVDGRELVMIDFPDYGEIEVDPAVSLVRQLGTAPQAGDDWQDERS